MILSVGERVRSPLVQTGERVLHGGSSKLGGLLCVFVLQGKGWPWLSVFESWRLGQ